MTFKHVKFQDSAVMRSLEKVAREKGLVKEQDFVKTASLTKKADLTPSPTLTANLIKLSVGLREAGFDKYADEVETKFMAFKQADTLYQTSKEKGEDLVEEAHPKGSHKLEGVEGDKLAIFETIIDQHLENMRVVDKMPTGKLTTAKDVIRAVKFVLAQVMPTIPNDPQSLDEEGIAPFRRWGALAQLKSVVRELDPAKNIVNTKMNTTTLAGSFNSDYNSIKSKIDSMNTDSITVSDIDSVISSLGSIESSLKAFDWKDWASAALAIPTGGVSLIPGTIRHVGDVIDTAKGNWDQAFRNQIMGMVGNAKSRAELARNNIRGANDGAIKNRLVELKQQADAKQQQDDTKRKQDEDKKKLEESQTPEMKEFSNRSATLFRNLTSYQKVLNGPGFTEEDRNNINPKLQSKIDTLKPLTDQYTAWGKAGDLSAMQSAAPNYLKQIRPLEVWADKLNKWMNA